MADIETEVPQDTQIEQTGLENLPPAERKETEELLGEIAKESPTEAKPAPEKKEDGEAIPPVKVEDKKPDAPAKVEEPAAPAARREASVVPAWKLKVAEDQAKKGTAELTKELEDTKAALDKALKGGAKPDEAAAAADTRLAALAEKSGIEVEVLKEIGQIFAPAPATADPKIQEALAEIEKNKADSASQVEIAQFSADFDKDILPLIKKEYGDKEGNVPPETVTKIKDQLAKIAYTSEYAKVPYAVIYRGQDEFRGVIPPASKGAEASRGGTTRMADADTSGKKENVDWAKLESDATFAIDDEDLKKLSDTDLDRYFGIVEKRK